MRGLLFAFQPVTNPRCDGDIGRYDEPVEGTKHGEPSAFDKRLRLDTHGCLLPDTHNR